MSLVSEHFPLSQLAPQAQCNVSLPNIVTGSVRVLHVYRGDARAPLKRQQLQLLPCMLRRA